MERKTSIVADANWAPGVTFEYGGETFTVIGEGSLDDIFGEFMGESFATVVDPDDFHGMPIRIYFESDDDLVTIIN